MEDGFMDSYGKMLDDLTAGLPEVLAEKVAKKNEFGKFSIKLAKVEAHLKEDFIPLGFNQFMFVPVTKHAESLASKYSWDSGSIWSVKEVEGDKLLVRDEDNSVIMAKRAMKTVEAGPYDQTITFDKDGYKVTITQEPSGHYIAMVQDASGNLVWNTNSLGGPPDATIEELQGEFEKDWPNRLRDIERNEKYKEESVMDQAQTDYMKAHDWEKPDWGKQGELAEEVRQIPDLVVEDVQEELKTKDHPLSTSEEQDLENLNKEKLDRENLG